MLMEDEDEIFHSPQKTMDDEAHDDEESKKLQLIRDTLHERDPSFKDVDEATLRRFLHARDLDIEKASAMLVRWLSWRRTFVPYGFVSESEVPNEIAQNKMFLQGNDKQRRPISVVYGSRHFSRKGCLDEFKRFLVFALDKLCQRIPDGVEKFTIIGDLQGYGYCNSDLRANLAAITILQVVFVEDKRLRETLLEDIDESQLPEIYGGKLQLVPIQNAKQ